MRNKIFISHATPDDNDFTKWLALKLIGLGYVVWCDILFLDKGVPNRGGQYLFLRYEPIQNC